MTSKLLKQLKSYENKWIAYTHPDEKIVGSGKDAVEASQDAEKKGYTDIVLFKVFPFDKYYVG